MNRLPYIILILAAFLLVAADKKTEKAKESAPSSAQIQLWVKQLGDESFKVREEATRDLINAGVVAFDAVRKATKSDDAEVKQRALRIIKQIDKQLEEVAIAYFKKLGGKVTVDKKSPGKPVIELKLNSTKVTDAGLVHLKGLTSLRKLWLGRTKITDARLVHLRRLTKLQVLSLWNTGVTDAGLVHLKGLANLRVLYLHGTRITDAGLVHLKGLTKLQELWLAGTKVTDAGLVHLKELTSLRELLLQNTKVTDAGLEHLKGLTNLRSLWLKNTQVTQAGIEKLKKVLPNFGSDADKVEKFFN